MTDLILEVLSRGFFLSIVGAVALLLVRRSSGATRHAIASAFLVSLLFLPLGFLWTPKQAVQVTVPQMSKRVQSAVRSFEAKLSDPIVGKSTTVASPQVPIDIVGITKTVLVGLWACVASLMLLRLAFGMWRAIRWARKSPSVQMADGIDVRVSPHALVPLTFWAGKHVILLPVEMDQWSESRRQAVLQHEMAHIRRGDWFWLVLSKAALAIHWPNPFVWVIARNAKRSAEDAADDSVILSGFSAPDYAEHLLQIGSAHLNHPSALAVPMASQPDLKRRIRNVLDRHRTRGSISVTVVVAMVSLLAVLCVPASALIFRLRAFQERPSSWASNIRSDLTRPGNESNGFVGILADKRKVRLVQISERGPNGVIAWKPDGTLIPAFNAEHVPLLPAKEHTRTLLFKYQSDSTDPDGALGSGSRPTPGEPSEMEYTGSGDRPTGQPGQWESYAFIGVPKEDGSRSSFTFSLVDEPWNVLLELHPSSSATVPSAGSSTAIALTSFSKKPHINGIKVMYPAIAKPLQLTKTGAVAIDSAGRQLHNEIKSTELTFVTSEWRPLEEHRVEAILKNGKPLDDVLNHGYWDNDDAFHATWFFPGPPNRIDFIRVKTRTGQWVAFNGVRLKPKG